MNANYLAKVNARKRWHPHLGANRRHNNKRKAKRYWSQLEHKSIVVVECLKHKQRPCLVEGCPVNGSSN